MKMKSRQKEQIRQLRAEGQSYKRIAGLLSVPVSTIASHCHRNNLTGMRAPVYNSPGHCRTCGKRLKRSSQSAVKRFCSDKCRMKWWKAHPEKLNRKAVHTVRCAQCDTEFVCYTSAKRIYCSRKCAATHRYHGKDGGSAE